MTYTKQQIELALAMLGCDSGKASLRFEAAAAADVALEHLAEHYTLVRAQSDIPSWAHDPVTDFPYYPGDPEGCRNARKMRALHELLAARLPGVPLWRHLEREKLKERGWALVRDSEAPIVTRIGGAQAVIQAHYARSASGSLNFDDPFSFVWHPGYDEYAAHYLHASPQRWCERFGARLFEALLTIYPCPPGAIRLAACRTDWPGPIHLAVVPPNGNY